MRLTLNIEMVMFGSDGKTCTDGVFDQILLFAKYFIYTCRINKVKPAIQHFMKYLKYKYKIEKYACALEMKSADFNIKWCPYWRFVESE